MKHSNKDNKKDPTKLSKKRLLPNEYQQYKLFGEPDLSQNWLELFTPTIVSDLFVIMRSCSDNQRKSKYIRKEMSHYGFEEVGLGTNIYVMSNPAYPGVVFKFALDDNGLADNFNDTILQDLVPRYTPVLARHPSATVSVQERRVLIANQDRMDTFRNSILKTLRELSKDFLIVDLSPTLYHLNYGIDRNGDWCFIDASDLYPLENIKTDIRCSKPIGWSEKHHRVKYCGGRFQYNDDFSAIICTNCGMERLPLEVRPDDKEGKAKMANSMMDGTTAEERKEMREAEMRAMRDKEQIHHDRVDMPETYGTVEVDPDDGTKVFRHDLPNRNNPRTIFISPEDDDDEDEGKNEGFMELHPKQPTREEVQEQHVPFVEPDVVADDDNEDEDPDVVIDNPGVSFNIPISPQINLPIPPELTPEEQDDGPADQLIYSVANVIPDGNLECQPGITIRIKGDFNRAYEDFGLPIYVELEDGSSNLALSLDTMKKILDRVVPDIIKEAEEIQKDREEAAAEREREAAEEEQDGTVEE